MKATNRQLINNDWSGMQAKMSENKRFHKKNDNFVEQRDLPNHLDIFF